MAPERSATRYPFAIACVLVAVLLRVVLDPVLGDSFPFATLFLAVLGASAYGGLGPALLATFLGGVAAIFILVDLADPGRKGIENAVGMGLYLAVSMPIALLGDALRQSRRRAEDLADAAARDRDQLRITLASIGEGVVVADTDGRIVSMNPAAERLVGRTHASAAGRPLEEVLRFVPEQPDRVQAGDLAKKVLEDRRRTSVGDALLAPGKGEGTWVDLTAAPIRDDAGAVFGLVVVFRDVSERRQAESAQRLLASIVENSQDAIYGKGLDGTITSWNDGATRIYGYTAAEIIGRSSAILTPADKVTEQSAIVRRQQQTAEHFETVRRRRDGTVIHVSTSISPVRSAAGQVIGSSTISRDITKQKRSEDALKKAQEDLRLEDRRKDEFLAVLAHELRNPLAPIRNALAVLKKAEAGSEPALAARDLAERQVRHLTRLVDDLLDVSRITHGRIELRKERLLLSRTFALAVETAEPAIQAHGHHLDIELPETPVWIEGDELRLVQVLANLLNNAAQYTASGGRIGIGAAVLGDWVEIRVSDTGLGIPAEALPRVFDMFTQVSQPELRAPTSLGIGLRLVKSLVELHGGTVDAMSDGTGRGSVFVVRLRAAPGETTAQADSATKAPARSSARRILVVDDNIDAAESLAVLLGLEGHQAAVATSGPAALESMRTRCPDVVLLDIGMPGMDGYEVAREIRGDPRISHVTLVALTGWGQDRDVERTKEAGFDRHLTKPVEPATLLLVIREAR